MCVAWDGNKNHAPHVIAPCGDCRQILIQYAPDVNVVVQSNEDGNTSIPIIDLIPWPYEKMSNYNDISVIDSKNDQ